jgi:hypothetical protein
MKILLKLSLAAGLSMALWAPAQAQNAIDNTYYSDGSCTPGPNKRCVSKPDLLTMCRKTSAWYPNVFALVGVMDRFVGTLYQNMGKGAFKNIDIYVSKSGDCMMKFNAVGSINGTSYDRTYYCKVTTIEDDLKGQSDSLAVKSVDSMGCFN